jgi:hypothetical protein
MAELLNYHNYPEDGWRENHQRCSIELVTPKLWPNIEEQVAGLWKNRLGFEPEDPILGDKDTDIVANNLKDCAFGKGRWMLITRDTKGKVKSMALFVSGKRFYKDNNAKAKDTAYLYGICSDLKDETDGTVGPMLDTGIMLMANNGFKYLEFHARTAQKGERRGFADVTSKVFSSSIIEKEGPKVFWDEQGEQIRFKLDIDSHLMTL